MDKVVKRAPYLEKYYPLTKFKSDFSCFELSYLAKYLENDKNYEDCIKVLPDFVKVDG